MLCRGTAWGCCPSPHGRGLCAGRPVCQERVGMTARVCGRPAADLCRARGWSARGRRDTLAPAAVATKRLPLSWPAHRGHCSRGCRHRGTGQPASLRRSRRPERHRSSTSRRPRSAALVTMLHPYGEPQQPVESCPCDALGSPAPCCLGGPRRHTSTAGDRSAGMHAPVAAPDAGLQHHPARLRTATDAYYQSHQRQAHRLSTAGTAQRTGGVY